MSIAIAAIGTQLKRGDGGVGAGTQASKTVSTSNQQIIAKALIAGLAGNSKTFAIVVSGNNTVFSYSVTANALTIISATDGSAVATTTVEDAIVAIQNDPVYRANWQLTTGAGNGSGLLVASASSALTGGLDGAEIFTLVPGVIDLGGPNRTTDMIDVTSHDSANYYREKIPGLRDGGQVSGELNWKPTDTQQAGMNTDMENRVLRNWQIIFPDGTIASFSAYVASFEITTPIDAQLKASFNLDISGPVTF